jgi:thiol:disulfide interchange protein DsbG
VQHVTSAGAVLTGLGESHGMGAVAARRGDQFMLFEVTPDGQAAVSGATVELTPDQLETIASGNITDLGVEHGLQSFFVRSGPQFQVFYTTPDKERLIPGVMWDVRGKDLTRQQIAHIPGAVPTVVVGRRRAPGVERHSSCCRSTAARAEGFFRHDRSRIGAAAVYACRPAVHLFGPRVADAAALCGRWPSADFDRSAIRAGSRGPGTEHAKRVGAVEQAGHLVSAWQTGSANDTPSPEAAERLRANMPIAQAIGLKGTPIFIWRKPDGTEGRIDGIPMNMDALVSSAGS